MGVFTFRYNEKSKSNMASHWHAKLMEAVKTLLFLQPQKQPPRKGTIYCHYLQMKLQIAQLKHLYLLCLDLIG